MPTCRCEGCLNTFPAELGSELACWACKKRVRVYQCGSCMKVVGLLLNRQSTTCPRCFTRLRPNDADLVDFAPRVLTPLLQAPPPPVPLTVLEQMQLDRDQNLITLVRKCRAPEIQATVATRLAGGEVRALTRRCPDESVVADQVGNNEGLPFDDERNQRKLALLVSKGLAPAPAPVRPRVVVEFSHREYGTLDGGLITVRVNRTFTIQGSGLQTEGGGGVLIQIGTPLSSVVVTRDDAPRPPAGRDAAPPFPRGSPPPMAKFPFGKKKL